MNPGNEQYGWLKVKRDRFAASAMIILLAANALLDCHYNTNKKEIDDLPLPPQGKQVRQSLTGGQQRSHHVRLEAGQYLRLVVSHPGLDIKMTLYSPEGKMLETFGGWREG